MIAALIAVTVAIGQEPSLLIRGGTVYDGTGLPGRRVSVRVQGDRIVAVGSLSPLRGERVIEARGMAVAPGFIDAHSHADGGIKEHPDAESQVRQGITTAVVGQDGIWRGPLREYLMSLQAFRPAINFAAFSGHGGIRAKVLGKDFERPARPDELRVMTALVEEDMKAGALGLSSGLEYNPGWYSDTKELVALARAASRYGGMYISHLRDETNGQQKAIDELARIGVEANLPAQISHVKLAVASQWGKSDPILRLLQTSTGRRAITADVYPYLYWSSTITVLTNSRDWGNRKVWEQGLADIGGAQNVRLTRYSPDPSWAGKTLAELSKQTGKPPADLVMEIIDKTKDGKGEESIVCTAMREEDLRRFIAMPRVMFCSDGSIGGSHPRGAGSFARIFGRYVRDLKVISLPEAVRKATSFPASVFRLTDRGRLRRGLKADIVIFDPKRIRDRATPENPTALSEGVEYLIVNGVEVLAKGRMTGKRGGKALFKRS